MFSTQGKGHWHLERAEKWQAVVSRIEDEALYRAKAQVAGRMQRKDGLETDPGYVAGSLLRDNHEYATACGNRNSHQRQAEIYFLAHIAGVTATCWDRTERGLVDRSRTDD